MYSVSYLVTYAAGVVGAVAVTPVVIHVARAMGLVDLPGARKVHQSPTPRIGGVAIAASTLFAAVAVLLLSGMLKLPGAIGPIPVFAILASSLFVLLMGLADDILNIPAKYKLVALLAASAAVCSSGAVITEIGFGAAAKLQLGLFAWPVTMLWIVGVTVAVNFIDGLDGLAAGLVAVATGVLAIVATAFGSPVLAVLTLALLGSLTGFLFYNFNPARVFMGDCGSMFIGFMLASCSILCTSKIGTTAGVLLPALTLAVPLLDTPLAFIRRGVLQRRSIFSAERGHIHHRLLDLGLCQRHVAYLLYVLSVAGGIAGMMGLFGGRLSLIAGLSFYVLLIVGVFRVAGSMKVRETIAAIRRNRALDRDTKRYRKVFEEFQLCFRNVQDAASWWREVCAAANGLDLVSVTLPLVNRDGTNRILKWRRYDSRFEGASLLEAFLPVRHRRYGLPLRMEVEVPAVVCLESAGRRVAHFSRLMNEHSLADLPDVPRQPDPLPDPLEITPVEELLPLGGVGIDAALGDFASGETRSPAFDPSPSREAPAKPPRIAVVHDFLYTYAGAERVLEQILQVFPAADLFSLFDFLPADQRGFIQNKTVVTTFLQRMPFARSRHRAYLPLMPIAIEQLDLTGYDIVISSSYVAAKGVLTRGGQLHVCYCHTPVRFAWDLQTQYLGQSGMVSGLKSMAARTILHYIRQWDLHSASRVDLFLTNSDFVGRRIEKTYRRHSTTLYPPVDVANFSLHEEKQDFYLTASRLVQYKRIDLIVEAFNRMPDKRLVVVGEGPELQKLRAAAGPNVRIVGHQSFDNLRRYMQLAKAFVFAAEEDFGITPVEAMACGAPVIAFGCGGVLESVVEGRTGLFFLEQTPDSLIEVIGRFESRQWDSAVIRRNAERFSAPRFRAAFAALIKDSWHDLNKGRPQTTDPGVLADSAAETESGRPQHLPFPQSV